ncbi:GTPase HflX [Sphaerisporangium melleum]|uniref:GTPase HflX n=1 Tax=Sphaerisporangium melleum TaxID=321316 RepID=A0A917R1F3_9ACTN|nr:GTPase HflX [Sphaerisporangium melleum]GGK82582.1 GTPase HflX [Sphaerisporangium melleum]GII69182.1 GTPase HflX [Sphaerisporangium melleum]
MARCGGRQRRGPRVELCGTVTADGDPRARKERTIATQKTFIYDESIEDLATGDYDLEERQALRRVAGLSTELEDITEVEYRQLRLERVVLVGVWTSGTAADAENSLTELKLLAETAGSQVLEGLIQRRQRPDPATYIGSGKAVELRDIVASTGADTVICDGELTPGQLRQLEDIVKVKVIDRTALILDIFAQHAKSREGKAQVELAQLSYLLPRLRGWGGNLSRQVGGRAAGGVGIGGRGPGETKIELDRRRIRERMAKLRRQISGMSTARETMRAGRTRREVPAVAIAGYTNAGKSSLLNRLTGAGVLVEDALFATLDPTVRRARTPEGRLFTLADTVGFVRHLPHQLVEAFRSTLEEVGEADLILHVVDGSHPDPESQIAAVREVFADIEGARDIPEIVVVNKADAADPVVLTRLATRERHSVVVSARTGAGIEELLQVIERELPRLDHEVRVLVPYERGDLVARAHKEGEVRSIHHTGDGTVLHAHVPAGLFAELERTAKPVEIV